MKAKKGFRLRTICGEKILVGEGMENITFTKIISMNESAAYLWERIADGQEFTVSDLADMLTEEYEVSRETALADSAEMATKWLEAGIVEEDKD